MTAARQRALRRARLYWAALGCYWLALFVGTHLPPPQALPLPGLSDKLVHFAAYAGLTLLLSLAWGARRRWRPLQALGLLAVVGSYAAADELLQLAVGRHGDVLDWLADMLGAMLVLVVWSLLRRRAASREQNGR